MKSMKTVFAESLQSLKPSLGSDNHSGIHPFILDAIIQTNHNHSPSYGTDVLTLQCQDLFKSIFGPSCEAFFVFNGTAANVLSIQSCLQRFEAVLCSEIAHLNLDECGAPEAIAGNKVIGIPHKDGKMSIDAIGQALTRRGDQHHSQPKMISITQPTELGTQYSIEELQALRQLADKEGLLIHVDGARLIYTEEVLAISLKEFVDILKPTCISFGGTKNGLLFGEAVLVFDDSLAKKLKYLRKQNMQLPSKMRFLAAQFMALLMPCEEFPQGLWKTIANQTHQLTRWFANEVSQIPQVSVSYPVQANSVFVRHPKEWIKTLRQHSFYYVWDEHLWEMRWMLSFDSRKEDLSQFLQTCQSLAQKNEVL